MMKKVSKAQAVHAYAEGRIVSFSTGEAVHIGTHRYSIRAARRKLCQIMRWLGVDEMEFYLME